MTTEAVAPPALESFLGVPTHPGASIREELNARLISPADLARAVDRPVADVIDLLAERRHMDDGDASALGAALELDARIWLRMSDVHRLAADPRQPWREVPAAEVEWASRFPTAEMARRGWIACECVTPDLPVELMMFFHLNGHEEFAPAARESKIGCGSASMIDEYALEAWLGRGEQIAEWITTKPYDRRRFEAALPFVRELAREPQPDLETLRILCAAAGVAVVVVDHLNDAPVSSVVRRAWGGKPLIQISLRHRWADVFWRSFFHAACHLIEGDEDGRAHIVVDVLSPDNDDERSTDQFARDQLVDKHLWYEFAAGGPRNAEGIMHYAASVGVHPGVLVGQMQVEGLAGPGEFDELRVPLDAATLPGVF